MEKKKRGSVGITSSPWFRETCREHLLLLVSSAAQPGLLLQPQAVLPQSLLLLSLMLSSAPDVLQLLLCMQQFALSKWRRTFSSAAQRRKLQDSRST